MSQIVLSLPSAQVFQQQPRWMRWLGPYFLIDQQFALSALRADDDPKAFRTYYFSSGLVFWTLWQITTAVGLVIGPVVPESWNLEFAVSIRIKLAQFGDRDFAVDLELVTDHPIGIS